MKFTRTTKSDILVTDKVKGTVWATLVTVYGGFLGLRVVDRYVDTSEGMWLSRDEAFKFPIDRSQKP